MEPTITRINEEAIQPFEAGTIDQSEALEKEWLPCGSSCIRRHR